MLATPGRHFLHSLFLAEGPLAVELDLDAGLSRQPLGVLAQPVANRLGKTPGVEGKRPANPTFFLPEECGQLLS